MCGFLGQFNTPSLPEQAFAGLLSMGRHRGPDQTGFWADDHVQFGFNRLSILDLSEAGSQPMSSHNGRYVVLFNGEIYNHLELRKILPPIVYRGSSDTETITVALENWGVLKTINALDGMFALVIYDIRARMLFLARDFAGVKPLFFGQYGTQLVFGSQYDQVQQHPLFKNAPLDPEVLKLYLQQHFMPAPFGLHKGLGQVRPGEIISFDIHGKRHYTRYWELSSSNKVEITDMEEAQRLVYDALSCCVTDQMISDVPLGAFLSGGVDSPLVCSFAAEKDPQMKVFSIGSDSQMHDESERARAFSQALKLQQDLWQLDSKQVLTYWDEVMKSLHEPMADFSILPTYLVSKLAKEHVSVALSGDGGDELFFGYERFWSISKNINFQHWPGLMRKGLYGFDKFYSGNSNLNSALLYKMQSRAHEGLHSRFRTDWMYRIFPDLKLVDLPEGWNVYDYTNQKKPIELLIQMRKSEFYGMMQKTLRKVDLASMENSLEVRVPFLQKKLIELSLRISPTLNVGKNKRKQVLKNIMRQRISEVPDDNIKRGFSVPLGKWIKEDLNSLFSDKLLANKMDVFGTNRSQVEAMIKEHTEQNAAYKWPLFTLYALQSSVLRND